MLIITYIWIFDVVQTSVFFKLHFLAFPWFGKYFIFFIFPKWLMRYIRALAQVSCQVWVQIIFSLLQQIILSFLKLIWVNFDIFLVFLNFLIKVMALVSVTIEHDIQLNILSLHVLILILRWSMYLILKKEKKKRSMYTIYTYTFALSF